MMPPAGSGTVRRRDRDLGGAATYNASATVNVPALCVPARLGCTDSNMVNHDPYATVDDGTCLPSYPGCLDPRALNYNCTTVVSRFDNMPISPCRTHPFTPRPTVHDPDICLYNQYPAQPPAPPPVPICYGCVEVHSISVEFQAAGTVEEVNITSLQLSFAGQASTRVYIVPFSAVEIDVRAASVIVSVRVPVATADHSDVAIASLRTVLFNPVAASQFLGITVQSTPHLEQIVLQLAHPPSPPIPELSLLSQPAARIGTTVGGVALVVFIAMGAFMLREKIRAYLGCAPKDSRKGKDSGRSVSGWGSSMTGSRSSGRPDSRGSMSSLAIVPAVPAQTGKHMLPALMPPPRVAPLPAPGGEGGARKLGDGELM